MDLLNVQMDLVFDINKSIIPFSPFFHLFFITPKTSTGPSVLVLKSIDKKIILEPADKLTTILGIILMKIYLSTKKYKSS